MTYSESIALFLGAGAVLAVLTTYPYLATAIGYRRRDNGLAFIVLLMGVGIWNGFFAAQLLTGDSQAAGYFLSLSMVGALLAGLGWFLFASTASSTPAVRSPKLVYGLLATLVGIDISLLVTNPVHEMYWVLPSVPAGSPAFAMITPMLGYWVHTVLLVSMIAGGLWLFGSAWLTGTDSRYTFGYTIGALLTAVAILGSSIVVPGGWSVAPLAAVGLTSIGWIQAERGAVRQILRAYRHRIRPVE